jgi:ABC-type nitrate/sulfonate/bicarbonate transport system substrate-binding protein
VATPIGSAHARPRRARRALLAATAAVLALVAIAACGGGGDNGGGGGGNASKPTTLKVGVIPIADVAPLYVGIKQGFFKQENLTIQPQLAEGGATITAQTVSGDLQVGFSNVTSLVIAASKKLPVQIVASGVQGAKDDSGAWDAVLSKKGSPIKDLKALEGKTVSVNNLNNVGPLTINTAMEKAGADYKKVKYVEVPFPDANAALETGRIDAAFVVEPFVSQGKAQGANEVTHSFEETAPSYAVATYFVTKQYAAQNKDVLDRFVRAINKSLDYAQSHPDLVRQVVPTYTKIPKDVAAKMRLPQWSADLNRPSIQQTADLAQKYGFIKDKPSLNDLIRQPSGQ